MSSLRRSFGRLLPNPRNLPLHGCGDTRFHTREMPVRTFHLVNPGAYLPVVEEDVAPDRGEDQR